jgi:hypothetical protein
MSHVSNPLLNEQVGKMSYLFLHTYVFDSYFKKK